MDKIDMLLFLTEDCHGYTIIDDLQKWTEELYKYEEQLWKPSLKER